MSKGSEDSTAADWNVELTAETADRAESILRDFATDVELEMAVIVDRSGGMIAGVATRQNVDVSTVGALVAGAFGAMGALARELGEPQVTESLHHGAGDTIYLREIGERFVLLGVTSSDLPAGLVREKGAQIAGTLGAMLSGEDEDPVTQEEEASAAADGPVEPEIAPQTPIAAEPQAPAEPEAVAPVEVLGEQAPVESQAPAVEPPITPPAQTGVFVERPGSIQEGIVGESTGSAHTEISVEDGHSVSMASLDPALRHPEPEETPSEPDPDPDPKKEESGDSPSYVFEIG